MKVWWKSKTLWVNVIGGIIVLLQYLGTINIISPTLLGELLVGANIVLRLISGQNLTLNKPV